MEVLQRKDWSSIRVPMRGDKVYKDECVYSFDTPVSDSCVPPAVLFVCHQLYYLCATSCNICVPRAVIYLCATSCNTCVPRAVCATSCNILCAHEL